MAIDPFEAALCRGETTSRFFPEEFDAPDPAALALCRRCPIREYCAQYGIDHDEVGIWGGLTDEDRRKIKMQRSRVKCPDCRSYEVIEQVACEICLSCGLSWPI